MTWYHHRRATLGQTLVAVTILVAGCGSDNGSLDSSTIASAPSSSVGGEAAASADVDPGPAATATPPTPPDAPAAADPPTAEDAAGDLEAWCLGWNSPPISGDTPLAEGMQTMLALDLELAAVAPPEISDAMEIELAYTRMFVEALEQVGWDEDALTDAQWDQLEHNEELDSALEELEGFARDNCT